MHLDASTGFGIDFCGTANVATDASIWKFKRLIFFHSTLKASGGLEIPEILRAIQAIPVLEVPESVETGSQVEDVAPVEPRLEWKMLQNRGDGKA